jgi:hypothetical protein
MAGISQPVPKTASRSITITAADLLGESILESDMGSIFRMMTTPSSSGIRIGVTCR